MVPGRREWADAFIKQARSDFRVYLLCQADERLEMCHRLHYLQMTCEKLSKAYRVRDTNAEMNTLTHGHVGFTKFLRAFLKSPLMSRRYVGSAQKAALKAANQLGPLIESLAPAVDAERTPQNTEYPWVANDKVLAPCEYDFPNLNLLTVPAGRQLLKWIDLGLSAYDDVDARIV